MNWSSITFDWNQARAFLVTAEEGSLSAAARALGLTQPTLGRQVAALEESLGVLLFNRTGRSMTLTDAGFELLDHVRAMGEAANQFAFTATGQSQAIEGEVRITASDVTAAYLLPAALSRLADVAPGILVEIVAANTLKDLRAREADIALRHVRPTEPDLIARKIREDEARLYATPRYLARYGAPRSPDDLTGVVFAGFEPLPQFIEGMNARGLALHRRNIRITSGNSMVLLELIRQGQAVGGLTGDMLPLIPEAVPVLESFTPIPVETWLVSHRELRTNRRMRLVFDLLAEELTRAPTGARAHAERAAERRI